MLANYEDLKRLDNIIFLSLSGSHVYGTAGPFADIDIQGVHVTPLNTFLSYRNDGGDDHRAFSYGGGVKDGNNLSLSSFSTTKVDAVTHDIAKVARLLLKGNGNFLEMLCAPSTVLCATGYGLSLAERASHLDPLLFVPHYRGLAKGAYHRFERSREIKKYLYAIRALLTAYTLVRYSKLEVNLDTLSDVDAAVGEYRPFIHSLTRDMIDGMSIEPDSENERGDVPDFYRKVYERYDSLVESIAEDKKPLDNYERMKMILDDTVREARMATQR